MILWILNLFLLLVLLVTIVFPRFLPIIRSKRYAKLLDNRDFNQKIAENAQLIDVREAPEFRRKHILGARNIAASQIEQSLASFRKDKDILLYENGRPSLTANVAKKLKKAGYDNIFILKDGLSNWGGKVKENS